MRKKTYIFINKLFYVGIIMFYGPSCGQFSLPVLDEQTQKEQAIASMQHNVASIKLSTSTTNYQAINIEKNSGDLSYAQLFVTPGTLQVTSSQDNVILIFEEGDDKIYDKVSYDLFSQQTQPSYSKKVLKPHQSVLIRPTDNNITVVKPLLISLPFDHSVAINLSNEDSLNNLAVMYIRIDEQKNSLLSGIISRKNILLQKKDSSYMVTFKALGFGVFQLVELHNGIKDSLVKKSSFKQILNASGDIVYNNGKFILDQYPKKTRDLASTDLKELPKNIASWLNEYTQEPLSSSSNSSVISSSNNSSVIVPFEPTVHESEVFDNNTSEITTSSTTTLDNNNSFVEVQIPQLKTLVATYDHSDSQSLISWEFTDNELDTSALKLQVWRKKDSSTQEGYGDLLFDNNYLVSNKFTDNSQLASGNYTYYIKIYTDLTAQNNTQEVYLTVLSSNCLEIKEQEPLGSNGVYQIINTETNEVEEVFCEMTKSVNSVQGGWILLMGSMANSSTFSYNSNYWTTDNTYNENIFPPTALVTKDNSTVWSIWKDNYNDSSWESKYSTFNRLDINQLFLRLYMQKSDCIDDSYDCYGDIVFDIGGGLPQLISNQLGPHDNLEKNPNSALWFFNNASQVTKSSKSGSSHYATYKSGSNSVQMGTNINSLSSHFFTTQTSLGICGLNMNVLSSVVSSFRRFRLGCLWNNESLWSSITADQFWGAGWGGKLFIV